MDTVDKIDSTPQVGDSARAQPYLLVDSIYWVFLSVERIWITYPQLWLLMTRSSGHYHHYSKNSIFWVLRISPPIYGGWNFESISSFAEQLSLLSTGGCSSPQIRGSYPQISDLVL